MTWHVDVVFQPKTCFLIPNMTEKKKKNNHKINISNIKISNREKYNQNEVEHYSNSTFKEKKNRKLKLGSYRQDVIFEMKNAN